MKSEEDKDFKYFLFFCFSFLFYCKLDDHCFNKYIHVKH